MNKPIMQPSLFDAPEQANILQATPQAIQRPDPTRQQLLDALETLFNATEAVCDLPDVVIDMHTTHGVTSTQPRAERLCPGYTKRQQSSQGDIALMIMHLHIVVITNALVVFQLRARPDRALVRECVDTALAWYHYHPQPEAMP